VRELHDGLRLRLARPTDAEAIQALMTSSVRALFPAFYDAEQTASAVRYIGVLDLTLIEDGTYFVVESEGGEIAGCGGWSRRATLYGGNQTPGRDGQLLDPTADAARVRAMYTNPNYARRGVGRLILSLCEAAAAAEGFTRLELMSTLAGEPLYAASGFRAVERLTDATGGAPVPLVRMEKPVDAPPSGPLAAPVSSSAAGSYDPTLIRFVDVDMITPLRTSWRWLRRIVRLPRAR
jgi:GNAT superfamily N-acetyltransferase